MPLFRQTGDIRQFLFIFGFVVLFIFTSCSSIKYICVGNSASADVFLECKLNKNIGSYATIKNDDGEFAQFIINNEIVLILLESRILSIIDNDDIKIINKLNKNIMKGFGIDYSNDIDDTLNFIDYLFEEVNVFVNSDKLLYDKKYFLDNKNLRMYNNIFYYYIHYMIKF